MSVSEKKYADELRNIEKTLITRLYTESMNSKKSNSGSMDSPEKIKMFKTFTSLSKSKAKEGEKNPENSEDKEDNSIRIKTEGNILPDAQKIMKFRTKGNFYKNKLWAASEPVIFDSDNKKKNQRNKMNTTADVFKICSTTNYIDPSNDLRFIDPRGKYGHTMTSVFNFKKKRNSPNLYD